MYNWQNLPKDVKNYETCRKVKICWIYLSSPLVITETMKTLLRIALNTKQEIAQLTVNDELTKITQAYR